MKNTMLAFVDFVRNNPEAMESIDSAEQGVEVLNALAKSESISRLVSMTYNSLFGDRLLLHLNGLITDAKKKQELYVAVAAFSPDSIGVAWEAETISKILAEADFRDLAERYPALLDETHPLRGKLNLDLYWERRVRRYLVRGDYRRTWDELNKARQGFKKPNAIPVDTVSFRQSQNIGEVVFKGWKAYACSKEMLATLIGELFDAMMKEGFVTAVTDADTRFDGSQTTIKVYEVAAPKNGRTVRSHDKRITYCGFGFACIFRIQEGYMFAGHGKLHIFEETGAQVIKIATYFRKKEDERRQEKYDAVVAEQVRSKAKK